MPHSLWSQPAAKPLSCIWNPEATNKIWESRSLNVLDAGLFSHLVDAHLQIQIEWREAAHNKKKISIPISYSNVYDLMQENLLCKYFKSMTACLKKSCLLINGESVAMSLKRFLILFNNLFSGNSNKLQNPFIIGNLFYPIYQSSLQKGYKNSR